MTVGFRDWLNREYFAIESNSSYTLDQKVHHLICVTAGICGVVAMQPLPFADIFALTPIQCYMGFKIARVRGVTLSENEASDALKQVAGAVGMGFLAQQGVIGLYKLGLPFVGGLMTFPLVAGMTVGIGEAMDLYFRMRAAGQSISSHDLKQAYKLGNQEGRNVQKPAVPSQLDLEQSGLTPDSTSKEICEGTTSPEAAQNALVNVKGKATNQTLQHVDERRSPPAFDERRGRSAPPSAIPPKRFDDLRKHYFVYFPNLVFADEALTRILEGDKSDQLTLERQFKRLDDGIVEPKHSINGTAALEQQAGDDLRIYYRARNASGKLEILLVGRKSTQKSDLKRVKSATKR